MPSLQQTLAFSLRLITLDLGSVAYQLSYDYRGHLLQEPGQVKGAILDYKAFLFQHFLYPDKCLSHSKMVDMVWHCHILNTQKYREDCQYLFGHVLHHSPYYTGVVQKFEQSRSKQDKSRSTIHSVVKPHPGKVIDQLLDNIISLFPEESQADLECLKQPMEKCKASIWKIRLRLFQECVELLWVFYVQIPLDNLLDDLI